MSKKLSLLLFIAILMLAAYFRLHGVNWDYNQHLHPDERFLTMVTGAIDWPKNNNDFLNSSVSTLNPHNRGFNFFVYGTFPIFFTKYIAETFKSADYNGITIIGRRLSALIDLGTVIFVFLIAREILAKKKSFLPHLAMFFYASLVLPIQLSHFYAVDTYLAFFTLASFYFLIKIYNNFKPLFSAVLLGLSLGLSIASKISAVYFFPVIAIGLLLSLVKNKNLWLFVKIPVIIAIVAYFTIRFAQPYLFEKADLITFKLNTKILANWKELKSFDNPNSYFPPAVQWIKPKPYIFPLKNMLFWGLGLPLGIISILAFVYQGIIIFDSLYQKKFKSFLETPNLILNLSVIWVAALFAYQGGQFVKALRYFAVLYPFLAILSAWFICRIISKYKLSSSLLLAIIIIILVYPFSFTSIYSREHSRIAASRWIYANIPAGSRISGETWDDYLPMSLPQPGQIHEKFQGVEFPLYNEDNSEKWTLMNQKLHNTDYIVMSSNRLYGAIMTVPEKYPVTSKFYKSLFDGSLGFEKVAEFTSRPNLNLPFINLCLTPPFVRYGIIALKSQKCPLPGISFVDDYSDETFTVYDHPKVVIFKKIKSLDYYQKLFQQ